MARRELRSGPAALALYAALSFAFFGVRLLLQHGRPVVGTGVDPEIFIWSFAWWPHAILHGENPIVTHAIWAPDGANLAWAATTPALAVAFTPLTLAAGPVASYDAAALLMPVLAAWTAFLLCRRLTRAFWPSLAGGYLYGFSSYLLGTLQGHLHLAAIFVLPLVALVLVQAVEGELRRRALALRLGLLLALQLWLSTEIAFTLTLALAASLAVAYLVAPRARRALRALPGPIAGGYALAALLASPLLWFALRDFHRGAVNPVSPTQFSSDLAELVVPTRLVAAGVGWASSIAGSFPGNLSEQGGYIGLPALAVFLWFCWRRRRTGTGRFLFLATAIAAVASLGPWLHADGRQLTTLPWEHLEYLPLFDNVLPVRLALYVALGVAVAVALLAASRDLPAWARAALPALAVAAIVPNAAADVWTTAAAAPPFVTQRLYERCLRPGDNVLVLPFGGRGDGMLWQADAGFAFRMADGYVAPTPPPGFTSPPGLAGIAAYGTGPRSALLQYVRVKHVTLIALDASRPAPWRAELRGVAAPAEVGGVLLYRLDGAPACRRA